MQAGFGLRINFWTKKLHSFCQQLQKRLCGNFEIKKNGGNLYINPGLTNVREYRGINKLKGRIYEKYIGKVKYIGTD